MVVKEIKSLEEFHSIIKANDKVVLDCYATWCGPCRIISPVFEKLSESEEFQDKAQFYKFDVDEIPKLAEELGVRAMPTFYFFNGGNKVGDMVGADPRGLAAHLTKYVG
ncbi:Thioredoxin Asp f 29 [Cladobotryum mycophilum]|uniref:Thioredoxin n=1 Tax=Cladobotryum mycophilum TaxID=491253 RepID=A0ABR0S7Y7_9HYPO